jgi:Glycosyltransferase family 87
LRPRTPRPNLLPMSQPPPGDGVPARDEAGRGGDAWSRPHVRLGVALILVAAALIASYARRPGDFAGYVLVGDLVLRGQDIYAAAPPGISTWPPFFAVLCAPLALLARASLVGARVAWLVLNLAALVAVLALVTRLVARGPGDARPDARVPALTSAAALVPVLLSARYVLSNFEHLQVNVLLFLLSLGGMALIGARREALGGLALGAAAALKVMPGLFVVYLVWRRRWRAAGWTVLATAALSLSPGPVFGWGRLLGYFRAWLSVLQGGWSVGKMNLSVYAMWDRTLGHGIVPFTVPGYNDLAPSHDPAVGVATALSLAAVAALALWSFRPRTTRDPRAELLEWSVVFLVASLFGTVSWKAYLVVLLLSNALLLDLWRAPDLDADTRKGALGVMLAAFVIGVLTTDDIVGSRLAGRLEMGSIVTLAALVMLVGLLWLRRRVGSAETARG